MVGELQVSGVEVMEGSDVALDQVLLLIVQLVQICEKQSVTTEIAGWSPSSPGEHIPHDVV